MVEASMKLVAIHPKYLLIQLFTQFIDRPIQSARGNAVCPIDPRYSEPVSTQAQRNISYMGDCCIYKIPRMGSTWGK